MDDCKVSFKKKKWVEKFRRKIAALKGASSTQIFDLIIFIMHRNVAHKLWSTPVLATRLTERLDNWASFRAHKSRPRKIPVLTCQNRRQKKSHSEKHHLELLHFAQNSRHTITRASFERIVDAAFRWRRARPTGDHRRRVRRREAARDCPLRAVFLTGGHVAPA